MLRHKGSEVDPSHLHRLISKPGLAMQRSFFLYLK